MGPIAKNPTLTSIDLSANQLTSTTLISLVAAIRQHNSVRSLVLRQMLLNRPAAENLSNYLETPYCRLHTLMMGHNNLFDDGCAAIMSALNINTTLRYVELDNTGFSHNATKALTVSLNGNTTLKTLLIRDNSHFGDKSLYLLIAKYFARTSKERRPLRVFDISGCPCSEEAVERLEDLMGVSQNPAVAARARAAALSGEAPAVEESKAE